jgi:hypothetical protein
MEWYMWLLLAPAPVLFFFCCCGCTDATCAEFFHRVTFNNDANESRYEIISGDWETQEVTGYGYMFGTEDANALALCDGIDFDGLSRYQAAVETNVTSSATDKFRIYFAYVDSSNYAYVEYDYSAVGGGNALHNAICVRVYGGLPTTLESAGFADSGANPQRHHVKLCVGFYEIRLQVWSTVYVTDFKWVWNPSWSIAGKVGIGTGATVTEFVGFGNARPLSSQTSRCCSQFKIVVSQEQSFDIEGTVTEETCDCVGCWECQRICPEDELPDTVEVTIPDEIFHGVGIFPPTACEEGVENNTYVLTRNVTGSGTVVGTAASSCGYFALVEPYSGCQWELSVVLLAFTPEPWPGGSPNYYQIWFSMAEVSFTTCADPRTLRYTASSGDSCLGTFDLDELVSDGCSDLEYSYGGVPPYISVTI